MKKTILEAQCESFSRRSRASLNSLIISGQFIDIQTSDIQKALEDHNFQVIIADPIASKSPKPLVDFLFKNNNEKLAIIFNNHDNFFKYGRCLTHLNSVVGTSKRLYIQDNKSVQFKSLLVFSTARDLEKEGQMSNINSLPIREFVSRSVYLTEEEAIKLSE